MPSQQFEKFKRVLQNVFMLDHAELDFGIYRIMNQKRDEIDNYLTNILAGQVTEVLKNNAGTRRTEVQANLDKAIQQANDLGVDPDVLQRVKELKNQMSELGSLEDLENSVYNHLSIFFSRYYDGGDFISQRRYKKDVYAIPYEGEEVKLYWANADQYYIKTAEYFKTYSFKLGDGKRVEFTLKEASTEQNNNRAQDNMERRFALFDENPIEMIDDVLHINFTYELMPKATKQKDLMDAAYNVIKDKIASDYINFAELLALRPTPKDPNRTLLQKHLSDYVARNTFDYFIHKDLQGFLSRELDFYIKNEVLFIDDIDAQHENKFLNYLSVIKALKTIGTKIIAFLASLENFQKKLWLKKKFVTECNYCITLDRVPEGLYEEICQNDAQREEWIRLFAIDEIQVSVMAPHGYSNPLSVEFLKENPFLVLDTAFFSIEFKHKLIKSIVNLDKQCDGLLINSENFQALELLQEKFKERVKYIYIDPPYNTNDDDFMYKDGYPDSSWLSMINDRLNDSMPLLSKEATIMVSIGDEEQEYLSSLIRQKVGKKRFFATLIWEKKKKGSFLSGNIAKMKDYVICVSKDTEAFKGYIGEINEDDETYPCINPDNPVSIRKFKAGITSKYRESSVSRPADSIISAGNMTLHLLNDLVIVDRVLQKDIEIEANWRYSQESLDEYMKENVLYFTQDLYIRRIVTEQRNKIMKDLLLRIGIEGESDFKKYDINNVNRYGWGSNEDANDELHQIFGAQYILSYPKPSKLITLLASVNRINCGYFIDYFAGSGTTGHAIININRIDGGCRKYILCEMAEYFNSVTKPRIEKVIYSQDWNNGKPVSRIGSSHCFKYIRLEQYEDTLNNLIIKRDGDLFPGHFNESYLLGYMLDTETRGSLFNTEWFINPFNVKLKIIRNNETKEQVIDLVETFNYLIGLYVDSISYPLKGICVVSGKTRRGEKSLIIWRDCTQIDNDKLNNFFKVSTYSTHDNEFDRIYVNGDNLLENLKSDEDTWKVALIEQVFKEKMFEEE